VEGTSPCELLSTPAGMHSQEPIPLETSWPILSDLTRFAHKFDNIKWLVKSFVSAFWRWNHVKSRVL
jgi:hypothetical protein